MKIRMNEMTPEGKILNRGEVVIGETALEIVQGMMARNPFASGQAETAYMGLTLARIGEADYTLPGRSLRGGRGLSARFTGSRIDNRSRGRPPGPDHQRQGTSGRGRWERVCHIGPLPICYAQSRLSPGVYRHVCHRGHSGQLRRSPGNGDEVCGGGVSFKVQFQSAKFAL